MSASCRDILVLAGADPVICRVLGYGFGAFGASRWGAGSRVKGNHVLLQSFGPDSRSRPKPQSTKPRTPKFKRFRVYLALGFFSPSASAAMKLTGFFPSREDSSVEPEDSDGMYLLA